MWRQNYLFAGDSLFLSALIASVPLLVLFYLLGVRRKASWVAALAALATAAAVALLIIRMPVQQAVAASLNGAAFGLFPISWIVFSSILLYRITLETGKFEIIKDTVGSLSDDRRLQLLLIGFCFSAFIEGSAGFGSPVAVSAAMLVGLGFNPFYAGVYCLLGNTAPVAFGSIGIPIITLAQITGLPMDQLSAMTGRILSIISVLVPIYMVVLMSGARGALAVWPALIASGVTFGAMQLLVSNVVGPELTDILSALAAIAAMVVLMRVWKPADTFRLPGDEPVALSRTPHDAGASLHAWSPYLLLVMFVLLWGYAPFKALLDQFTMLIEVPGLHNLVERVPPVTAAPSPYGAVFTFGWLSAAGTACFLACVAAAIVLRVRPAEFARLFVATLRQLAFPILTIVTVLAVAFLMNYSGMTSTLGLAFAASGAAFPFFSPLLGWLGVMLTGSVTSSNALFGNLQVVTATSLDLNPILTASANGAGGVMGKMVSLQSIAVAVAATGMAAANEGKLFRFMLRHSVILVTLIGLITLVYAYAATGLVPEAGR